MAWYHWISTYLLIIAAFAFWTVMPSSLLFKLGCIVVGLVALAMMRYLPPKEDENKPISWPKWMIIFREKTEKPLGIFSIVFIVGILLFALYMDFFN